MFLVLDSGAFSVWNKGMSLDIDAYLEFIFEKGVDSFDAIINLDVIPSHPGMKPTASQVEHAARAGWQNYKYMLKAGVPRDKLVHVFHQGESFDWLDRFVKEGLPYIGLSPANDSVPLQKMGWVDKCMDHVTDANGYPLCKWHGFAAAGFDMIRKFPWYTVDSITFRKGAGYGHLYLPVKRKSGYDYSVNPVIHNALDTVVLHKSPISLDEYIVDPPTGYFADYVDWLGLPYGESVYRREKDSYELQEGEKKIGETFIRKYGLKMVKGTQWISSILSKGVSNDLNYATYLNMVFYKRFCDTIPPYPWPYKRSTTRSSFGLV